MQAATALHAAVNAPDRVAGLVLVLPPTGWETRPGSAREYIEGAELVERRGVAAYVDHVNEQPPPQILAEVGDDFRFTPAVAGELLPSVLRGAADSDLPAPEALGGLTMPVLVLAWRGDPGHPVATAQRITALFGKRAELDVAATLSDVLTWTRRVESFIASIA